MEKEFEAFKNITEFIEHSDDYINCFNALKTEYHKDKRKVEQALIELQAIKEAKPSEAVKQLDLIVEMFNKYANKPNDIGEFFKFTKAHEKVKQALLKAEQDNTTLKLSVNFVNEVGEKLHLTDLDEMLERIEKLEKAWEVVKAKRVDIFALSIYIERETWSRTSETALTMYNEGMLEERQLTEQEFDLLKEMLE